MPVTEATHDDNDAAADAHNCYKQAEAAEPSIRVTEAVPTLGKILQALSHELTILCLKLAALSPPQTRATRKL